MDDVGANKMLMREYNTLFDLQHLLPSNAAAGLSTLSAAIELQNLIEDVTSCHKVSTHVETNTPSLVDLSLVITIKGILHYTKESRRYFQA